MKNFNEDTEIGFLDEKQAADFFSTVCQTDIWQRCSTSELKVIPVDDAPILMDEIRSKLGISQDVTDDSMRECMESLNIGISVPFESGYRAYPIGDTALGTLVQRAGYQMSPVLMTTTNKSSMTVMAPCCKADVLNSGLKQFKNKSLVLIRDEKIRAVLSGDEADYQIFEVEQLINTLKKSLQTDFMNVTFDSAFASHQYMGVYYLFDAVGIIGENAKNLISRAGITPNAMKIGVRLVTSDVGLSGANLYPYVSGNGHNIMFGNVLSLTHKGSNSMDTFQDNVGKLMALFKDAENKIERMNELKVKHPSGCLMRAAKQAGLPKKISCEAAETLESTFGINCYQADVFFTLYDILESYDSEAGLTASRRIQLEEGISRVAFCNFDDYDIPFQWE